MLKNYRLKNIEIKRVLQTGRIVLGDFLNIKFLKNSLRRVRFAIVVSTKIDKRSTRRNKIKRRLREAIRTKTEIIKPCFDLVFLTKKEILDKNYKEICQEVVSLLGKIKKEKT